MTEDKGKINLLFLVNGFAIGGGELKVLELVQEFKSRYDDVFHCVACAVGQGGPLQKDFEKLGVRTEVVAKKNKYDLSQVTRIAKLMQEEQIDVVQTTLFYADVIGTFAAKLARVPHVVSWEAITEPYSTKQMLAYKLASRWYSMSVSVSNAIQKQVIEDRGVPPEKTMTIHYGVDLERFKPVKGNALRKELALKKDDIILGTVARLTTQKGHTYLIDAMPKILEAFPKAQFVWAGGGPLQKDLEDQAKKLGVRDHIHILGFRSDIRELVGEFDLFVLPSLWEGFPNVVLEVMACGKPIVATAVDGTPEAVIDGETGFLVPSKQPVPLADAIVKMLSKSSQLDKMGKAGRKRVETHFTLDKQVDAFASLFQDLHHSTR